tara:strand:- start:664 stop:1227 length:564 start_codon:yes stop_codon:yes gene_type:complete
MLNKLLGNLGIKKENRTIITFILLFGLLLVVFKCYNNYKSSTFDFMSSATYNSVDEAAPTGSTKGRLEDLLREDENLQGSELPEGVSTDTHGLPPQDLREVDTNKPNDLLPINVSSEWSESHSDPSGILNNVNLLPAGAHIGVDTVGQTLRNANLQLRAEPPNPKMQTGPWNLSTIDANPEHGIQEC